MFAFKKVIASFLLPPGLLILVLIAAGAVFFFKKRKKCATVLIAMGLITWIFSIAPVSNLLLQRLEAGYSIPTDTNADVIILLGGGFYDEAADLTGKGFPGGDMLARIVTAVRLQKRLNIPVIISDRNGFKNTSNGVKITKRLLVDFGVKQSKIIIEDRALDTNENAKFSKAICDEKGFVHPIVLTSALHLKRACLAFESVGLKVIPFPAFLVKPENEKYGWYSFLPSAGSLLGLSRALHEYLGILYYKIT